MIQFKHVPIEKKLWLLSLIIYTINFLIFNIFTIKNKVPRENFQDRIKNVMNKSDSIFNYLQKIYNFFNECTNSKALFAHKTS